MHLSRQNIYKKIYHADVLGASPVDAAPTDPFHQSQNASEKYPTMHHFVTEMCTFLLQNVALWDMGLLHCGIYELGPLHLYSLLNTWFQWIGQRQLQNKMSNILVLGFGVHYTWGMTVMYKIHWNKPHHISSGHQSYNVFNSLRPRQNGRRFADDTFKRIFLNENVRISIKISMKLFPRIQLTIIQHWFR